MTGSDHRKKNQDVNEEDSEVKFQQTLYAIDKVVRKRVKDEKFDMEEIQEFRELNSDYIQKLS